MQGANEYEEDALIAFLQPDESMKEFLSRALVDALRTSLPFIDDAAIRPGNVVEFCGASGSGKTEVLMQAIATCILPEEVRGVAYGGFGGAALCFDLDAKFDILRLVRILETRINEAHVAQGGGDTHALNHIFTASLQRFRLLQCHSTLHLLAALKTIQPEIQRIAEEHGSESLRLICIDRDPLTGVGLLRAVVTELKYILTRHRPLLLVTKGAIGAPYKRWPIGSASQGNPDAENDLQVPHTASLYHKEYMPAVWQDLVTQRLMLQCHPAEHPGVQHQDGPPPSCVFSAQWDKPPASEVTRFVISDGYCKCVK